MGRTLRCEALHGDISQNQRERTLAGFRDGSFNVLVATDVAARGLDVPNVDLVCTHNFTHLLYSLHYERDNFLTTCDVFCLLFFSFNLFK